MAGVTEMDNREYATSTAATLQPFRPNLRWSTESCEALKSNLADKTPPKADTHYKIALFGAVQSGKSSLVNTWLSAMRGKYVQLAHSAPAEFSVTKEVKVYPIRRPGRALPILLCDTMGYELGHEEDQWIGPNMKDVAFILDGLIDDGYVFDQLGISFSDMKKCEAKTKHKVNLVAIVWDAVYVSNPTVIAQLKAVMKLAQDRAIACCILLTKVDKCSEAVDQDLTGIFTDERVLQAMETVSEKLEIEMLNIFPIQNYTPRNHSCMAINCLALHTLTNLLELADVTLERQYGLPEDHITRLLPKPWKNWKPGKRTNAIEELDTLVSEVLKGHAIPKLNIAVIGLLGSGKSQFINAVLSTLHGKPKNEAATGRNKQQPITKRFRGFETPSKIQLYDTMGMAAREKQGIQPQDLQATIKGHLDEETVFNALTPCSTKVRKPTLEDQMHAVVLVLDGSSFPNLTADETSLLRDTYHKISDLGVPCVAVVSHLDQVCQHVQKSAAKMFESAETRDCVEAIVKSDLGLPRDDVLPVVTFSDRLQEEQESEEARHALLLSALNHVCDRAKDYVACQPLTRVDASQPGKQRMVNVILAVFAVCAVFAAIILAFQAE